MAGQIVGICPAAYAVERERKRTALVIANWGGHKSDPAAGQFIKDLARRLGDTPDRDVLVAPPASGLRPAIEAARGTKICIACQDVAAGTGQADSRVAPSSILGNLGVTAALIGHRERRRQANEDDPAVSKKVRQALAGC